MKAWFRCDGINFGVDVLELTTPAAQIVNVKKKNNVNEQCSNSFRSFEDGRMLFFFLFARMTVKLARLFHRISVIKFFFSAKRTFWPKNYTVFAII